MQKYGINLVLVYLFNKLYIVNIVYANFVIMCKREKEREREFAEIIVRNKYKSLV